MKLVRVSETEASSTRGTLAGRAWRDAARRRGAMLVPRPRTQGAPVIPLPGRLRTRPRGEQRGPAAQPHFAKPSLLAARSLHQEAPLELRAPECVRRLHGRRVQAGPRAGAVAVPAVPVDRPPARAETAPNRLHPPTTRVPDRDRHDRGVVETESDPEVSAAAVDDDARRARSQIAERPVQVEAPLDLRVLSLVVERIHDPAPAALRLELPAGKAPRPPCAVPARLAGAAQDLA